MDNSNLSRQEDEIEALKSIFSDDFTIEDEFTPTFSIVIHVGKNEGEEATLVVSFNADYPSKSPPLYHLSIPWIRGDQKIALCSELDNIYLNKMGECIVYDWVEKLREILLADIPVTFKLSALDLNTNLKKENEDNYSYKAQPDKFETVELPAFITGEPLTDRKSTFQAHVARIASVHQIKPLMSELLKNKKIASATHNIYAYRVFQESSQNWFQDCEDDGETHAGSRLLHLLKILDCRNVLVVVTRWFGGIMLYGDRFKHINNVARKLLEKEKIISLTPASGEKRK